MSKILELRNKRNELWEQTKSFLEAHRGKDGLVEASAVEQYNKMTADVKGLGEEIKRLEEQLAVDADLSDSATQPVFPQPKDKKAVRPTATAEYNEAFWNMVRGDMSREVLDVLSVGKGTDDPKSAGGYTVPDEFEKKLVEALEENNIFRKLATVIKTSSGTRSIPIAEDSGEASWIEEGSAITESDMTFSQATLSAYKQGTLVRVTTELLDDSAFDLADYIARRFGVRFGRGEEKAFFVGKGPSQNPDVTPSEPTGILTQIEAAKSTAGAGMVTFDDVIALYSSLTAPYRGKASFVCNESVLFRLMQLKDATGAYIWKPALDVGKPDTILGRPIYTSQYMPAMTGTASADKNKKIMLFGDFKYYWIADRRGRRIKRLNERYAEYDQVGFIGTQRVDGKLILPEAVQCLKLGNS
jgi:HK97 family phage major capsid protein